MASEAAEKAEAALRAKLAELNLSQFADKLVREGVESLEMLAQVDDAGLSAVGMGVGHKNKVKSLLPSVPLARNGEEARGLSPGNKWHFFLSHSALGRPRTHAIVRSHHARPLCVRSPATRRR